MAIAVLMPALSPTMEEGNIAQWLKKEGDKIASGEIIAEIETDKATMEVEATDPGILGKILVKGGTKNVKVNTLIAVILEKGEDISAADPIIAKHSGSKTEQAPKAENKPQTEVPASTAAVSATVSPNTATVHASPLAKRIAESKGVDLSTIQGSGPNGRIVRKDIESVQQTTQQTGRNAVSHTLVPHSNMRYVIAKRLAESKQTVPHFYLSLDVDVSNLNKARKQMNEYLEKHGEKISVNDIIIKACAAALEAHPNVNASWSNEGMMVYNNVDISVAVGIPDGLITPIIKNANMKGLREISKNAKNLIKRARENKLALEEFQGGNFTISNLGMYNISHFSAIINPPQSAILAVGSTKIVPCISKETGLLTESEIVTLTLSCDHRVVDGVLGAEFLNTVKNMLENPSLMVL